MISSGQLMFVRRFAFTLMELVITISIVGILGALLLTVVNSSKVVCKVPFVFQTYVSFRWLGHCTVQIMLNFHPTTIDLMPGSLPLGPVG